MFCSLKSRLARFLTKPLCRSSLLVGCVDDVHERVGLQGGPADQAGLKAGDRIVSVDGSEIAAKDDLGTLMQKHAAGDTLAITVARDGQMQTVNVTLGEKTASNS